MFIHINAFNFINIISLSSVGRNKKVKKKKKKKGDRSLLFGSIVITEQVETSHFFLRTEACSSV